MPMRVEGLDQLRAALRAAPDASAREVRKALRGGAVKVTARARQNAPKKSGRLAGSLRPFATQRSAGVRSTLIYAGVQEFAVDWVRSNPRRGHAATRGEKLVGRAGGRSGGTNTVHYNALPATPRFATKAVEDLAPELMEETFDQLVAILHLHGWFV